MVRGDIQLDNGVTYIFQALQREAVCKRWCSNEGGGREGVTRYLVAHNDKNASVINN